MPHYVDDPENPGTKIDVHALQERHPLRDLDPIFVVNRLRDDSWTLREALQILAGYDPTRTQWEEANGQLFQTPPGLHFYLDGLSSELLRQKGLTHPRRMENLSDINDLMHYARHSSLDERRTPAAWIDWAESKAFAPYWLGYPSGNKKPGLAPAHAEQVEKAQADDVEMKGQKSPVPAKRPKSDFKTLVGDYLSAKLREVRINTAKSLYAAVEADAGTDASPFDRGTGGNRGKVVHRGTGKPFSVKTFQNNWADLQVRAGRL